MPKKHTKEQLLELLRKWTKKHKRSPTMRDINNDKEMPSVSPYIKYFGSFNKGKELAGVEIYRPSYTKEQLLELLRKWTKKHKRSPSAKDIENDESIPPLRTYANHFGSFNNAKKLADLEIFQHDSKLNHVEGLLKEWKLGICGEIKDVTITNYLKVLIRLEDFLKENGKTLQNMTVIDLKNFVLSIRDKYTKNTMKGVFQAIRNFLKYFLRKAIMEETKPIFKLAMIEQVELLFKKQLKQMEDDSEEEPALSEKEVEIIKAKLKEYPFLDVMFRLDLNLGLRACEFCKIKITEGKIKTKRQARRNDIWLDLDKGVLMIYREKTKKPHLVALTEEMNTLIKKQLILRKLYGVSHSFLFFSKRGKPLKSQSVQCYYRQISRIVAFRVTSHKVRRTMSTLLEKRGVPHSITLKRMGHAPTDMTRFYQKYPIDEKKEILEEKVGIL